MGGRIAAVLLLGGLVLTACQIAPDRSLDAATLHFNEVGFRGAPGGHPLTGSAILTPTFADHRVVKWTRPIRYRITGFNDDLHATAERFLIEIAKTARIKISVAGDGVDDANFIVRLEDVDVFEPSPMEYALCYANVIQYKGHINRVSVHIARAKPRQIEHCLVHEILHGFGLAHASRLPSAVNYAYQLIEPSSWDWLAVRALYDARLIANKSRTEMLPVARQVLRELQSTTARSSAR